MVAAHSALRIAHEEAAAARGAKNNVIPFHSTSVAVSDQHAEQLQRNSEISLQQKAVQEQIAAENRAKGITDVFDAQNKMPVSPHVKAQRKDEPRPRAPAVAPQA